MRIYIRAHSVFSILATATLLVGTSLVNASPMSRNTGIAAITPSPGTEATGASSPSRLLAPDDEPHAGWEEVGIGSATGGGISYGDGNSSDPSAAIAPDGTPYIAWWYIASVHAPGAVYVRRWNGSYWAEVGYGSASGDGISDSASDAFPPVLAIAPDGTPYVAWSDGYRRICVRRWNGNTWEDVGASAPGCGGISSPSNWMMSPSIAISPDGTPYVSWEEDRDHIYAKQWNGSDWVELGAGSASGDGISDNAGGSRFPSLAVAPDGTPYVAWSDDSSGDSEIYIRRLSEGTWEEVGLGSATGGGLSNNDSSSVHPSVAIAPDGTPYVGWKDDQTNLYVRRWNGSFWEEVGVGSATGDGLSGSDESHKGPSIAISQYGTPYVAWSEAINHGPDEIYILRWNNCALEWEEVGEGSASGGGISDDGVWDVWDDGASDTPSVAVAPDGTPYVAWSGKHDSWGEVYVRRGPGPEVPASVSHIEVTQATQNVTNTVPLIADKPTFVRVYVDGGEWCDAGHSLTGVLRGYGPEGELPGSPISPVDWPVTVYHEDWQQQRGDLEKTLNFTLPPNWRSGTITLTPELTDFAPLPVSVTFQTAQSPHILYVPIRYSGSGLFGSEPDSARIALGHSWAERVFPTEEIIYTPSPTINWFLCLEDDCLHDWLAALNKARLILRLNRVYRFYNLSDSSDVAYVFGWLPAGTYDGGYAVPDWTGTGAAGFSAFGDDLRTEGQRVFAHEIGHLMGRGGINTTDCPNEDIFRDWDYPDAKIQDYGLDGFGFGWLISSPDAVKDPTDTYDYMSPCAYIYNDTAWTSPWTYEHILDQKLTPEATAPRTTSSAQRYLISSGLVFTDDTAVLDPIFVVTSTVEPENPPQGTEYCLETRDSASNPLVSQCFDLAFLDYDNGGDAGLDVFDLMLPSSDDVHWIILRKDHTELVSRLVSTNVPSVTVISPNGGETWAASGIYTITWEADDADGDLLTYNVLYSQDGDDWVPIAVDVTETQLAVNAAELAGGDAIRVQVMASDGINTASDESDGVFSVGHKPPSAHILSPEEDLVVPPNSTLWFQGYAYDLEDGVLEDSALQWSSNRDGLLGMGSEALTTLSQGQHIVTLTATDSDNYTATAAIKVTVAGIAKSVVPEGQVNYGDELTYTVVISTAPGTQVGFYDPLEGTTFQHFVERPPSVSHTDGVINGTLYLGGVISGTLEVTPTNHVTVSFVTRVGVPGTVGWTADVTNRACVFPLGGTLGTCTWSNEVTNRAFRPYDIYLPLVLRTG